MTEPIWLDPAEVTAVNRFNLQNTNEPHVLRDRGALEAALSRPQQAFAYGSPTIFDMAALYVGGIDRSQAFLNGNKRTAFIAAVLFLQLNGCAFLAPDERATERMVLQFVTRVFGEKALAAWLYAHSEFEGWATFMRAPVREN